MLILVGCTYQAVRQQSEDIMSKTEFYADLNRDFQALMAGETSFLAMIANTSALLFERLSEVNWAGFYLLEGDTLVLGPFQGKLACVRIPVGRGVCGAAVAQAQVQRVEDVHAFRVGFRADYNLVVAACYANKGPTMKRIQPRAQGRAYRIEKRTSHITIVLDEK